MSILSAGQEISISLVAKQALVISLSVGAGVVESLAGYQAGFFKKPLLKSEIFGPFIELTTLKIVCLSGSFNYETVSESNSKTNVTFRTSNSGKNIAAVQNDNGSFKALNLANPLQPRMTRSYGPNFQTAASPALDGRSWHQVMTAEAPYHACRIAIKNNEATGYTLNGFKVAASTSISNPIRNLII